MGLISHYPAVRLRRPKWGRVICPANQGATCKIRLLASTACTFVNRVRTSNLTPAIAPRRGGWEVRRL